MYLGEFVIGGGYLVSGFGWIGSLHHARWYPT